MARYSKGSQDKVEKAMHEFKQGTLKSGGSGKKVTSRKQAIAIGLSEAREQGEKVPEKSSKNSSPEKSTAKKEPASKKTASKKSTTHKKAGTK